MINKKVLVIAPYPIKHPQHGGQKRVKALLDFYQSIFSEVKFAAVFHRGHYGDRSDNNVWLGQLDIIQKIDRQPYASELIAGEAISSDIHVKSAMAKLITEYRPDIIEVEKIYPYLGLKQLLKEQGMKPILILSHQNIEYRMKHT